MPVDRDRYLAIAGSFPTGVANATARDGDGSPRGLTTQSFIGVSTDPPLMLVSIDKTSRTLAALRSAGRFVNFVRVGSNEVATTFASKSDHKFAGVPWRPSAVPQGAPILHECSIAYAGCVTAQQLEAGDHWVLIGSVEGGAVLGGTPLLYHLYHRRTYAGWAEEKPAPQVG